MTYLNDQHKRELLEGSGIAADVAEERGYRTITRPTNANQEPRREVERLGIPGWATKEDRFFPGLLIPIYRATGERISAQFKPNTAPKDPKTGKPRRYASVKGQTNRLDVHPRNVAKVADPTVPLWITEGVKKADALTSAGACVVALSGVFNWRGQHGTLGDWEDVPLRGREVVLCFDADARTNPNVARAMGRLGAWCKSKGVKRVVYLVTPGEVDGTEVKGADDYLAAGGTLEGLRSHGSATAPAVFADNGFTDARMAETVADDVLEGSYAWCKGLGGWLEWDGTRWRPTDEKAVTEAVRRYVLDRAAEATEEARSNPEKAGLARAWLGLESAGKIRAILGLAGGIVLRRAEEFDRHRDLLNTPSGVVDLTTGELGPHDPDLCMTKVTATSYVPGATHKDWDAVLEAVPVDCREWVQLRYGQAITGHMTPDDRLLIQQGGGENGKTTVTGTVGKVLGDYYALVSDRLILANPSDHPTEYMDLRGARLAVIDETPEARRLSVSRLKKTVGQDKITARYCGKDNVTFDATHTLILSTNYTPVIEETDHGTWRRLLLLRFPFTFRKPGEPLAHELDRRGDPTLRDRAQTDPRVQEAALAWLVAGAVAWYAADRIMPEVPYSVVQDTAAWRAETDVVAGYLDERVDFDHDAHVISAELLADFNDYLRSLGQREWSDKTFGSRFGSHDLVTSHRVEKRLTRKSAALSRPGPAGCTRVGVAPVDLDNLPANYKAWRGIRFRKPEGALAAVAS